MNRPHTLAALGGSVVGPLAPTPNSRPAQVRLNTPLGPSAATAGVLVPTDPVVALLGTRAWDRSL